MALIKAQATVHCWLRSFKRLLKSQRCTTNGLFKDLKKSYDWTNGCRKFSIVLNPCMVFSDNSRAEILREEDVKGAVGCFLLLSWVLLLIGRKSAIALLYTILLTGIVLQYALLQGYNDLGAQIAVSTPSDKECIKKKKKKEEGLPDSLRINEPVESAAPRESPCAGLAIVASVLAFCCVPLAASALVVQLLGSGDSYVPLAPLPAAWCTLLAACSLLPGATHGAQRARVILPCGVLFTLLALLFLG